MEQDYPVEVVQTTALESLSRAEIDVQIATAHRFPRSVDRFKKEALSMATHDEETAASCFYKLTRKEADGGVKVIEGPGVRLAEITGSCWGNMRYGARVVSEDDHFITAQGVAHDLERNVSTTIEVRRRISGKTGRKYSPDMIAVTANAACSIALRNAIFKVVPRVFVNSIYEAAKKTAIGNATTLVERRGKMIDHFAKMGVSRDRILAVIGKPGIEDIDLTDLETLIGLSTSIKDGDMSVDEAFPAIIDISDDKKPEQPASESEPEKKKPGRKKKEPEPEQATAPLESGETPATESATENEAAEQADFNL